MTLSELSDIGEIVGGVAVVASLVYLALQIRQNTRAVRGSTLHFNVDLWAQYERLLSGRELVLQLHHWGADGASAYGRSEAKAVRQRRPALVPGG
jgi:hypothetical protein